MPGLPTPKSTPPPGLRRWKLGPCWRIGISAETVYLSAGLAHCVSESILGGVLETGCADCVAQCGLKGSVAANNLEGSSDY